METSAAAGSSPPGELEVRSAQPWAQWTICISLLLAMAMAAMAFFMLVLPATPLPEPFPSQHQDAETATFVFALVVALPLSLLLGLRLARTIGPDSLTAAAAFSAVSLFAVIGAVRIVGLAASGDALHVQLALSLVWLLAIPLGLPRFAGGALPQRSPGWLAPLAAGIALVLALGVVDLGGVSWIVLAVGLLCVFLFDRLGLALPALSSRLGLAVDLAAIALIILCVVNLRVIDPSNPFETRIIQFHQDFFIGPAERVLAGDPVLTGGTLSQYGVGSIDFVAGWFAIAPENNISLGVLEGLLSAAMFTCSYAAMRVAGVARSLSALAIVVALFTCVFALVYPLGGLLQHGAIRFGMPVGVVLGAVCAAARPERERVWWALQLAILGIASIWALEAFAYTLFTFAVLLALRAALAPPGRRRRPLLRDIGAGAGAVIATHLVFAGAILLVTGSLPDWGEYLHTLKEFLNGKVGDLTYDFEPFSPAFAVMAAYLGSAVGIVLMVREPSRTAGQDVKLTALAGFTAWGIALFSYFVNRSAGHILPYICLPAFGAGAVWLSLLRDAHPDPRSLVRRTAVGAAGCVAAMLVAVAFAGAGRGFSGSALAVAAPGGESIGEALDRISDPPPITPGADTAAAMLETYMPNEERSLVLTAPDAGIEILARAHRANLIPFGDPLEESLVPSIHESRVRDAVDALEPGQRMLVDQTALDAFATYRRQPHRDPITNPLAQPSLVPTGLASLQDLALKRLGQRFDLKPVSPVQGGFQVVELVPRRTD